jgi:hypothetical protein
MEDSQQAAGETAERGVSIPVAETVVALFVLALGLTVLFGSRKLGSGWTTDGPGAGYFPFYIGVILCISAAGILYQALLSKSRRGGVFVTYEQVKQVMTVLVPAAVYVLAVQLLGIYVASAIYIAGFMVFLGKYSWAKSAAVGIGVCVLFFLMFEVWFKVPLYKGALKPLDFLGY